MKLLCIICLDPINLFFIYDKIKLYRFIKFYPNEFLIVKLIVFEYQLNNYILDMHFTNQFYEIMRVSGFVKKFVQLKKCLYIPINIFVYEIDTTLIHCNCNH